jgi:hypothetical protein
MILALLKEKRFQYLKKIRYVFLLLGPVATRNTEARRHLEHSLCSDMPMPMVTHHPISSPTVPHASKDV